MSQQTAQAEVNRAAKARKGWDEGFADGTQRILGCCAGDLQQLRGRREAFRRALERMDESIADHERNTEQRIYEAQGREDARADRENRKPRLISTLADIDD